MTLLTELIASVQRVKQNTQQQYDDTYAKHQEENCRGALEEQGLIAEADEILKFLTSVKETDTIGKIQTILGQNFRILEMRLDSACRKNDNYSREFCLMLGRSRAWNCTIGNLEHLISFRPIGM